ncbi:hypothetical protein [Zobellella endophytica]|nr:hypothetical protein [Zobellella endophytica]
MLVFSRYRQAGFLPVFHSNGGVCDHFALMAPFWGFFMVSTSPEERC